MSSPLFLPSAKADAHKITDYFEELEPGLGQEVWADIKATLAKVEQSPRAYRILFHGKIRQVLTKRFPVEILYEAAPNQVIVHRIVYATSDYQDNIF